MTPSAATELQIRALMEAVDRADQAGNRQEAERALAQARAAAPEGVSGADSLDQPA
jgi:hypothetical protein